MYSKYDASGGVRDIVTLGGQDYEEIGETKFPLDAPTDVDYDFIDEDQKYDFPVSDSAEINPYAEVGPYNEVKNTVLRYVHVHACTPAKMVLLSPFIHHMLCVCACGANILPFRGLMNIFIHTEH